MGKGAHALKKSIYKRGSITIYIVPHNCFTHVTRGLKHNYEFVNQTSTPFYNPGLN